MGNETMSPSGQSITKGQASKIYDVVVDALVKSGLPAKETQQVLEAQGAELADQFVGLVRERVEAISEMIVRRVKVNRNRTQQEMLDATGRVQYINKDVVGSIPGKGDGEEEMDVYFFPFHQNTSAADAQVLLDKRGLEPDGYAVAAVNEADPSFAEKHPNATQWVDEDGKHCYIAFGQWGDGGRGVVVYRNESDWGGSWWLGGVRK